MLDNEGFSKTELQDAFVRVFDDCNGNLTDQDLDRLRRFQLIEVEHLITISGRNELWPDQDSGWNDCKFVFCQMSAKFNARQSNNHIQDHLRLFERRLANTWLYFFGTGRCHCQHDCCGCAFDQWTTCRIDPHSIGVFSLPDSSYNKNHQYELVFNIEHCIGFNH